MGGAATTGACSSEGAAAVLAQGARGRTTGIAVCRCGVASAPLGLRRRKCCVGDPPDSSPYPFPGEHTAPQDANTPAWEVKAHRTVAHRDGALCNRQVADRV